MKKTILVMVILLTAMTSIAQKLSADQILGVWLCEDYKIEVFKTGNAYSAKLLWAKDMFEADDKTPKKDVKNPDDKLKSRSIQGITHITGLIYKDNEYLDGKLYSPQDGNTYSFKGQLKSTNSLETRGYRGTPMFGKTYKWKRVQ